MRGPPPPSHWRSRLCAAAVLMGTGCSGKVLEPAPSPRYNATARLDAGGKVLHLVGGADETGLLADAWALDIPHRQWVRVEGPSRPILSGCAARLDDTIQVFGGSTSERVESDRLASWETLGGRWIETDAGSDRPAPRREATLTRVGDGQAVLVGGNSDDAGDPGETFGDVWGLERAGPTWTPVDTTDGPDGLQRHATTFDGDRLWIHGGMDSSGTTMSSLWSLDPTSWTWTDHTTEGDGPAPRADHLLGHFDGRLVIWGGAIDDTLMWIYDIESAAWSTVDAGGPSARDAFAWDQVENEPWMIVVGGDPLETDSYASDVWLLELDSLTWREAKRLDGNSF